METWLKAGTRIKCTSIAGKGKSFSGTAGTNGMISFDLAEKNSYALYNYSIIN